MSPAAADRGSLGDRLFQVLMTVPDLENPPRSVDKVHPAEVVGIHAYNLARLRARLAFA